LTIFVLLNLGGQSNLKVKVSSFDCLRNYNFHHKSFGKTLAEAITPNASAHILKINTKFINGQTIETKRQRDLSKRR